jgi:hypothetical protein
MKGNGASRSSWWDIMHILIARDENVLDLIDKNACLEPNNDIVRIRVSVCVSLVKTQHNKRPKGLALSWQVADRGRIRILKYVYVVLILHRTCRSCFVVEYRNFQNWAWYSGTRQETGAKKIKNFVVKLFILNHTGGGTQGVPRKFRVPGVSAGTKIIVAKI